MRTWSISAGSYRITIDPIRSYRGASQIIRRQIIIGQIALELPDLLDERLVLSLELAAELIIALSSYLSVVALVLGISLDFL